MRDKPDGPLPVVAAQVGYCASPDMSRDRRERLPLFNRAVAGARAENTVGVRCLTGHLAPDFKSS
jgi:hypothetical protein